MRIRLPSAPPLVNFAERRGTWGCLQRFLVIQRGPPPPLFFLRSLLFFLQPADLGRLGRAGWFALAGRHRHFGQQPSQFFQAVCNVATLVPIPLAGDHQLAQFVDPATAAPDQSLANRLGQARGAVEVPFHGHFGVDLVDVLTARAAATVEAKLEFLVRNLQETIDYQLGHVRLKGYLKSYGVRNDPKIKT